MGLMKGGGGGEGGGGNRGGGGEIVQVQGGHIVRATGRKDRHSKVYTSKGPRDRRVRLSAHTAIQFYDVQDRLGFDRPSKAVDWLIKKAKSSIDKLVELPPWEPPNMDPLAAPPPPQPPEVSPTNGRVDSVEELGMAGGDGRGSDSPDDGYDFSIHRETGMDPRNSAASCSTSLFQSQLDTMPFFGTSSAMGVSSSINFDDYHRSSTNQDLGLSLHPFQAPSFGPQHEDHINQAAIFPMTADDPRFMFNPPPPLAQPLFLGQTQSSAGFLQRGTLQSSFAAPRSFEEFQPIELSSSSSAHHHHSHHPSMLGGGRFAAEAGGGFSGFCLQSQMQQDDDERDSLLCRPLLSREETSPVSSVPSSLAG